MNVEQFIAAFRSDMGDASAPYLWSDEDIVRYLNDAVNEAATRAFLIEDSTSAACSITLVPSQASYALNASVISVKRVTFSGKPLTVSSVEDMDDTDAGWEAKTGTQPQKFIVNGAVTEIRVYPTPTEAGTLALTVYRTPLEALSADDDTGTPEIKTVYHERLKNWMYRCALLKDDAETFDRARANDYEARFTADFGERQAANAERKRRDKRPPRVQMNPSW